MDEYTELPSLPYSSDPQKTDEIEWIGKWLAVIEQNQKAQIRYLKMINTAIQIIAVLILLGAILAACNSVLRF